MSAFKFFFSLKTKVTALETIYDTHNIIQNNNKAGDDISKLVDNWSNMDGYTTLFSPELFLYAFDENAT